VLLSINDNAISERFVEKRFLEICKKITDKGSNVNE
jgi:hypothetical protein